MILDKIPNHDFYHTFDYHAISVQQSEKPVLITYQKGNEIIAMPLVIRNIGNTGHNDITSAYGYCGPIHNGLKEGFCNQTFITYVHDYLKEMKVISAFSRLNPFIEKQNLVLDGLGNVKDLSKVVSIDLCDDIHIQSRHYNPRLKTYINKCRKHYTVREAKTENEIKKFVSIYYENMLRVNAKDRYFFPGNYFLNLWKSNDFKARFLLAFDMENKELAGGAVFVEANHIVQYHLSGARKEYLKLNPIKLLIDEMRIEATKKGFSHFNLGGGVGNNADSLLRFKTGFSKNLKTFQVWEYIVNPTIYNQLVKEKWGNSKNGETPSKHFFPQYR